VTRRVAWTPACCESTVTVNSWRGFRRHWADGDGKENAQGSAGPVAVSVTFSAESEAFIGERGHDPELSCCLRRSEFTAMRLKITREPGSAVAALSPPSVIR